MSATPPPIDQLLAALLALYSNTEPGVREQASRWLEQWQHTQDAWSMAHDVLQRDIGGLEATYFCAQTLRTKVERDFEDLPLTSGLALRDSLLSLLLTYAKGHAPVRTQLCVALASLATHLPAAQWDADGGVVGWLALRLGSQPPETSMPIMLELLTVLPQEAGGHHPALRPERRRQLRQEMEASLPRVLSVLAECLARADRRGKEQALEAFAEWLKLCPAGAPPATLLASPLTTAALEGLRSSDAFYAAADAVIELIYCSSSAGRPREEMAPLVQVLVPEIMGLRPRFHVCAAQALAELQSIGAGSNGVGGESVLSHHQYGGGGGAAGGGATVDEVEDAEENAKAIARLFAEVGEAYTELIATGAPEVMPPVEALLEVAAHPDDGICAISFNFWHRLSRTLTAPSSPQPLFGHEKEQPAISQEESNRRIAVFRPTFQRLVTLLRGQVRFPPDFDSWHREERADFKRSRVVIGDTLMDAALVLGGAETLRLLVEPLMELSARVGRGGAFDWQAAEAALYCVRCVYRVAPPPGDPLLLQLFSALPSLPAPSPLQYTAALTVGAYSDWLAVTATSSSTASASIDAVLSSLFEMLVKGLSDGEAAGACALSLKRLCDGCAPRLASASVPTLLELYRKVQSAGDIAGEEADDLELDEEDVGFVVEAVTLVVSALPDGERQACVQRMMDVVVQPMQAILQPWMAARSSGSGGSSNVPVGGEAAAAQLALVLPLADRLTTIFRTVRDPGDVGEALLRLSPWLEAALDAFATDAAAVERILKVPRNAIRSAGKLSGGAVPVLASSLPARFEASAHPAYLYVASELIKVFGGDDAMDAHLGPMLTRLLTAACSALTTLHAVSSRPDLADDTFLLAGRALSYAPRLVITPHILPTLLDTVQAGMLVQHPEACGSIAAFVLKLLDPANLRRCGPDAGAHLQAAMATRAPTIVRLALAGTCGALPPARLHDMTDILYAILKVAQQQGLEWVHGAMEAVGPDVLPASDRQQFMSVCHAIVTDGISVNDESELFRAMGEVSESCRRNRRVEGAVLRALLPHQLHSLGGGG